MRYLEYAIGRRIMRMAESGGKALYGQVCEMVGTGTGDD